MSVVTAVAMGVRLCGLERGLARLLEQQQVYAGPARSAVSMGRYGPLQITYDCSVVVPLLPGPVPMKFTTHVPVVPPPVG
jgi:hypothetical protein